MTSGSAAPIRCIPTLVHPGFSISFTTPLPFFLVSPHSFPFTMHLDALLHRRQDCLLTCPDPLPCSICSADEECIRINRFVSLAPAAIQAAEDSTPFQRLCYLRQDGMRTKSRIQLIGRRCFQGRTCRGRRWGHSLSRGLSRRLPVAQAAVSHEESTPIIEGRKRCPSASRNRAQSS